MEPSEVKTSYEIDMLGRQDLLRADLTQCIREVKGEPGLSNLQLATILKDNLDYYDLEEIIKELKN